MDPHSPQGEHTLLAQPSQTSAASAAEPGLQLEKLQLEDVPSVPPGLTARDGTVHQLFVMKGIAGAECTHSQLRSFLRQYNCPWDSKRLERTTRYVIDAEHYSRLFEDSDPELERAHTQVGPYNNADHDCTFKVWPPEQTYLVGAAGWAQMVQVLETMHIPQYFREDIKWWKEYEDVSVRSSWSTYSSCLTPVAALGPSHFHRPSIVLHSGVSESIGKLRLETLRWLRATMCEPETDTGTQCAIMLHVHPIARQILRDGGGVDTHGASEDAMTIEIWRNARDETDDYRLLITGPESEQPEQPEQVQPVMVSRHVYTVEQLRGEFIPEFQRKMLKPAKKARTPAAQLYDRDPPIPRNVPMAEKPDGGVLGANQNDTIALRNAGTDNLPYFTIYIEDLITQSLVPSKLRNLNYVNIPYRIFMDAYINQHAKLFLSQPPARSRNYYNYTNDRYRRSDVRRLVRVPREAL